MIDKTAEMVLRQKANAKLELAFQNRGPFVVCRSADGYSLHEPGATDEQIANGDAPYLVSEAWEDETQTIPQSVFAKAADEYRKRLGLPPIYVRMYED